MTIRRFLGQTFNISVDWVETIIGKVVDWLLKTSLEFVTGFWIGLYATFVLALWPFSILRGLFIIGKYKWKAAGFFVNLCLPPIKNKPEKRR